MPDLALTTPLPNPEDANALAKRVLRLGEIADRGKIRPTDGIHLHKHWADNWRRFRGHHHDDESRQEPNNEITINKLRPTVVRAAATLAASPPRFGIEPREPGDLITSQIVQMMFDTALPSERVTLEYNKACLWQMLCGAGCIGVEWDPELLGDRGDVALKFWDPRYVFPDPNARTREDLTYVITAYPVPLAKAKRWWPQYADRITAHPNWAGVTAEGQSPITQWATGGQFFVRWAAMSGTGGGGGTSDPFSVGQCLVINCITGPDLGGGAWRQTVVINGELVVYDEEWPIKDWPLVWLRKEEDPDSLWCDGLSIDLDPAEQMIERRHAQIADHHDAQMIGVLALPVGSVSLDTIERLANLPYEILPFDPMASQPPNIVAPVPISGDFFKILEIYDDVWEELSGNTKALQGLAPEGVSSGLEQAYRQEAATVPFTPVRRNNEVALQSIATVALKIMQLKYSANRYVRVVGSSSKVNPEFWSNIGYQNTEAMAQKGPVWVYLYNPEDEKAPALPAAPNVIPMSRQSLIVPYDVAISSGSTMPTSRTAQYERAVDLFKMKPSPETFRLVLEYSGLPEWEQIWGMIQQRIAQEEAAAAQPLQGQAPPMAPPGGNGAGPGGIPAEMMLSGAGNA